MGKSEEISRTVDICDDCGTMFEPIDNELRECYCCNRYFCFECFEHLYFHCDLEEQQPFCTECVKDNLSIQAPTWKRKLQ